jgi:hypothetical protein
MRSESKGSYPLSTSKCTQGIPYKYDSHQSFLCAFIRENHKHG